MIKGLVEMIRNFEGDKNLSKDHVLKIISDMLLSSYKKEFGEIDNARVEFLEDEDSIYFYAIKTVVSEDDFDLDSTDILLEDAKLIDKDAQIGDHIKIELDPKSFSLSSAHSAKQKMRQDTTEAKKNRIFADFKNKKDQIVIGYFLREYNGNIMVNLGKNVEGILPAEFQSPKEDFRIPDEKIKALVFDVKKIKNEVKIVLSRTHNMFIQRLLEAEITEIADGTITIHKIVREPGYRTKIAVFSNKENIDPVGICVGVKGSRIQTIKKELEGEAIDIVEFSMDERTFIKNALSPAKVEEVHILNSVKKSALAIISEDQLVYAIGKKGLNIRLANRLVDWNIDVKTRAQAQEMDINLEIGKGAFLESEQDEEITEIYEIPGITQDIVETLNYSGIDSIEQLSNMSEDEVSKIEGLSTKQFEKLKSILSDLEFEFSKDIFSKADKNTESELEVKEELEDEIIEKLSDLPGINAEELKKLESNGILKIADFYELEDEEIEKIGLSLTEIEKIRKIIDENVEFEEEEE